MRAISTFSFDTGMSTRRWPAWQALRTRVSMSATGSITLISPSVLLPTGLAHAGNLPAQRQIAEADAAQFELPQRAATAAASLAPVVAAHLELRFPLDLLDPGLLRHAVVLWLTTPGASPRNGMPSSRSKARAVSSRPALVTTVMSIP